MLEAARARAVLEFVAFGKVLGWPISQDELPKIYEWIKGIMDSNDPDKDLQAAKNAWQEARQAA